MPTNMEPIPASPTTEDAEIISRNIAKTLHGSRGYGWGREIAAKYHIENSTELNKCLKDMSITLTHSEDGKFASVLYFSTQDDLPIIAKLTADESYRTFITELVEKENNQADGFPNPHLPRLYSTTSFTSPAGESHVYCMERLLDVESEEFKELPEQVQEDVIETIKHMETIAGQANYAIDYYAYDSQTPEQLAEAVDALDLDVAEALTKIIEMQQQHKLEMDISSTNVMLRVSEDMEQIDLVFTDPVWNGRPEDPQFIEEEVDELEMW